MRDIIQEGTTTTHLRMGGATAARLSPGRAADRMVSGNAGQATEVTVARSSDAENVELFWLLVDQSPDVVIFADRQGIIRIWNSSAAALFG